MSDALGSTLALADASGALLTTYTYGPFGSTTAAGSSSTNSFQYTGRENDQTGLYYYRARYYDPSIGRFIGEDPIGFNAGQTNFYSYTGNSPILNLDPTGLAVCIYYIKGGIYGNGWMYCLPDKPGGKPLSFPAASGNNGDAQHHCKNNLDCAGISDTGPIPPGPYSFGNPPGTHTHAGTPLIPWIPNGRSELLFHFCQNPFGPSRNAPYCSKGCITATPNNVNALNNLLRSEPGSWVFVEP